MQPSPKHSKLLRRSQSALLERDLQGYDQKDDPAEYMADAFSDDDESDEERQNSDGASLLRGPSSASSSSSAQQYHPYVIAKPRPLSGIGAMPIPVGPNRTTMSSASQAVAAASVVGQHPHHDQLHLQTQQLQPQPQQPVWRRPTDALSSEHSYYHQLRQQEQHRLLAQRQLSGGVPHQHYPGGPTLVQQPPRSKSSSQLLGGTPSHPVLALPAEGSHPSLLSPQERSFTPGDAVGQASPPPRPRSKSLGAVTGGAAGAGLGRAGTILSHNVPEAQNRRELTRILGKGETGRKVVGGADPPTRPRRKSAGGDVGELVRLEAGRRGKPRVEIDVALERETLVEGGDARGRMSVKVREWNKKEGDVYVGAGKVRVVGFEDVPSHNARHIFYHHSYTLPIFQPGTLHRSSLFDATTNAPSVEAAGGSPSAFANFRPAMSGTHELPFALPLPITHFPRGPFRSAHGSIRYILIASLKLYFPSTGKKSIAHFYRHVTVYPFLEIDRVLRNFEHPLEAGKQAKLGWSWAGTAGKVELSVRAARGIWIAGQQCWVDVGIRNDGAKKVKTLTVQLLSVTTFFHPAPHLAITSDSDAVQTSSKRKLISESILEAGQSGGRGLITGKGWWKGCEPKSSGSWGCSVLLPPDALSINRGRLIEVSYFVRVSANNAVHAEIPIRVINFLSVDPPPCPNREANVRQAAAAAASATVPVAPSPAPVVAVALSTEAQEQEQVQPSGATTPRPTSGPLTQAGIMREERLRKTRSIGSLGSADALSSAGFSSPITSPVHSRPTSMVFDRAGSVSPGMAATNREALSPRPAFRIANPDPSEPPSPSAYSYSQPQQQQAGLLTHRTSMAFLRSTIAEAAEEDEEDDDSMAEDDDDDDDDGEDATLTFLPTAIDSSDDDDEADDEARAFSDERHESQQYYFDKGARGDEEDDDMHRASADIGNLMFASDSEDEEDDDEILKITPRFSSEATLPATVASPDPNSNSTEVIETASFRSDSTHGTAREIARPSSAASSTSVYTALARDRPHQQTPTFGRSESTNNGTEDIVPLSSSTPAADVEASSSAPEPAAVASNVAETSPSTPALVARVPTSLSIAPALINPVVLTPRASLSRARSSSAVQTLGVADAAAKTIKKKSSFTFASPAAPVRVKERPKAPMGSSSTTHASPVRVRTSTSLANLRATASGAQQQGGANAGSGVHVRDTSAALLCSPKNGSSMSRHGKSSVPTSPSKAAFVRGPVVIGGQRALTSPRAAVDPTAVHSSPTLGPPALAPSTLSDSGSSSDQSSPPLPSAHRLSVTGTPSPHLFYTNKHLSQSFKDGLGSAGNPLDDHSRAQSPVSNRPHSSADVYALGGGLPIRGGTIAGKNAALPSVKTKIQALEHRNDALREFTSPTSMAAPALQLKRSQTLLGGEHRTTVNAGRPPSTSSVWEGPEERLTDRPVSVVHGQKRHTHTPHVSIDSLSYMSVKSKASLAEGGLSRAPSNVSFRAPMFRSLAGSEGGVAPAVVPSSPRS